MEANNNPQAFIPTNIPKTLIPVNLVVETSKVFRDLTIIAATNKNFESSRVDRNCNHLAQKIAIFYDHNMQSQRHQLDSLFFLFLGN
jgi:hypothetical protein